MEEESVPVDVFLRDGGVSKAWPNDERAIQALKEREEEEEEAMEEEDDEMIKDGGTDDEEEHGTIGYFELLFSHAKREEKLLILVGTIAAACAGAAMPVMTIFLGDVFNSFNSNAILYKVGQDSLSLLYIGIAGAGVGFVNIFCWMYAGERIVKAIRTSYLRALLRQEIGFYDKEASRELVTRLSTDMVGVNDAVGDKVGTSIEFFSQFIAGIVIGLVRGPALAGVVIACIPLLAVAGGVLAWLLQEVEVGSRRQYSVADGRAREALGAIRTVVAFTAENRSVREYAAKLKHTLNAGTRSGFLRGGGLGVTMLILFGMYGLALWYGSTLIRSGGYDGGQVMTTFFAVLIGGFSLGQLASPLTSVIAGKAAAAKVFYVIKRKTAEKDSKNEEPSVLDIASLKASAGETLALVGQSGSGKSTVIALLERFYEPLSGRILVGGIDIRHIPLSILRGEILGLVSQEPVLFGCTIGENIQMGRAGRGEEVTQTEIEEAAKSANAHDFIMSMPNGYATNVGEGGVRLSGGQRQRIAIARAILKNPRLLLLDEATSALDAQSECLVQDALDNLSATRTTLIVAHRLSTIRNADTIAVLERGGGDASTGSAIVEIGNHNTLIKKTNGAYKTLVELQTISGGGVNPSLMSKSKSPVSNGVVNDDDEDATPATEEEEQCSTLDEWETENEYTNTQQSFSYQAWRVFQFSRPDWSFIFVGIISAGISGCAWPFVGLLLSDIINVLFDDNFDQLKRDAEFYALMFLVVGVGFFLSVTIREGCFGIASSRIAKRLRTKLFSSALHQEISFHDRSNNSSAAVAARLATDAERTSSFIQVQGGLLIQNAVTLILGLTLAFIAGWQLTLIMLGMMPLFFLSGYFQLMFMKGFSSDSRAMYEDAMVLASEAIGNMRTVVAFTLEKYIEDKYSEKLESPLQIGKRSSFISGGCHALALAFQIAPLGLAFYLAAVFVSNGTLSFQQALEVIFVILFTTMGAANSTAAVPDLSHLGVALNSVFRLLDRIPKIDSYGAGEGNSKQQRQGEKLSLQNLEGNVQFVDVSFTYPTREKVTVLSNISLEVKAGYSTAIVGQSGTGKSTLLALLLRFYDPIMGQVLVDGIDIRKFDLQWYRSKLSLVQQEPILFDASILENIMYGSSASVPYSPDEVEAAKEAAVEANAHAFIDSFPSGYNTLVGERGIQLSGGQKQRIAIARALLRKASIILLDEATSALDARSERLVQQALDSLSRSKTTFIVAHRLSTVKDADAIAVMTNGGGYGGSRIEEVGTHEELIGRKGAYSALVRLQTIRK